MNLWLFILASIYALAFIGVVWLFVAYWLLNKRLPHPQSRTTILAICAMGIFIILMGSIDLQGMRYAGSEYIRLTSIARIFNLLWCWVFIVPYWMNKGKIYGFTHSRDFLLLRKPVDPATQPHDPSKGLFVPSVSPFTDVPRDQIARSWSFLAASILLGIAMMLVFFAIIKALFGFGPFF